MVRLLRLGEDDVFMRVAASEELMRSGSDGLVASLRGQRSVNRILSIGGGTHEIMNEVIAKQLGL